MRLVLLLLLISSFIACNTDQKEPARNITQQNTDGDILKLIEKYPDSALLKEELVQFYREKGNYELAAKKAIYCLKSDSINARWYYILATLQYENADTAAAIKTLEEGLYIIPDRTNMIFLGTLYALKGDNKAFNMAIALFNPDFKAKKEAYYISGLCFANSGEKQKAIEAFNKSLNESYTFMEAYREKALALYDLGRFKESLETLDKAITVQNNFDEGYFYRGRCLEKLNRKEEAADSYKMALNFDKDYTEAKQALNRLQTN